MLKSLLKIRILQIYRELRNLTLFHIFFLTGGLIFIGIIIFSQFNKFPNNLITSIIIALTVFFVQINRKDRHFIPLISKYPAVIYFFEYCIFSLPFLLIILFTKYWYTVILILFLFFLISFISYQPKQKKAIVDFTRFIPSELFEWIAGMRRYGIIIVLLYFTTLGLCFVKFVSLFIAWIITTLIAEFYDECEPYQILAIDELPARKFIIKKMRLHSVFFLKLISPVVILYSFFNYDTFYITIGFLLFSLINLNCSILSKYSHYQPNSLLTENKIINGMVHLSIIVPVLLPLPIIMLFRNYLRANKKLNNFLNAYN